ncbi:MAG: PKD domain-containing protein [Bacteroidales bacterium]|nr:PKD domain-containing protein [Bacteroidales bacterium]
MPLSTFAANLYWVGGSGYWNDPSHWSLTSGGAGGAGIPDENTDVYFENLAAGTVISVSLAGPGEARECRDFMWLNNVAGVQFEMVTASFLYIYGDVQLNNTVTYTWRNAFVELSASDAATYTIKSATGVVIENLLVGYGPSLATWKLLTNLETGSITHISGELDFNNRTITTNTYKTSDDTNAKELNIGNSSLTLKFTDLSPFEKTFEIRNKNNNNFTYTSGGSSWIYFSSGLQAADNELMATADMGTGINYDNVIFMFSGRLNAENCHFKTLTSGQIRLNNGWSKPAVQGSFYMQNLLGGSTNPAFIFKGNTIDNLNFGVKNNYIYGENNTIINLNSRGNIFFAGSGNVIHTLTATRWPSLQKVPGPVSAAAYANRFFFWDVASAGVHEIKSIVLQGDPECEYNVFWCQQDGSQAEIKTDNPLVLNSVNLKGIIHDPTLLPAKGQATLSIDSGLNQNWDFTTACQPYTFSNLPATGCYDNNDGEVTITVDNIRSDLQYQIKPLGGSYGTPQASGTFAGLQQGIYTVQYQEVVNGTPCNAIAPYQPALITETTPVQLDGPDTLRLFVNPTNPITQCPDSSDAIVELTAYNQSNGVLTPGGGSYQFSIDNALPPEYAWSGSQSNPYTADTLAPGTYYAYAKYDYGSGQECISFFSLDSNLIQVTAPPPFDTLNPYSTPATCFGYTNGEAFMDYTGGTPFAGGLYNHQWSLASPGAPTLSTDAILTGQQAGVYTDTITDANGCRFARNIEITQPDEIDFTVLPNPASGTASLTPITGGNGPAPGGYTYKWTFPDAGTILSTSPPPITGISGTGQLCCTVTDKNGCYATDCKAFQTLTTPNVTAPAQINCYGGDTTIAAEAVGGSANYVFELFLSDGVTPAPGIAPNPSPSVPSEYTFHGVTAGSYKIKVTDGQPTDNFVWSDVITIANGYDVVITQDMANSRDACYGQANGQIAIEVNDTPGTSSTSDYDIEWYLTSNYGVVIGTGNILANKPAGSYTAHVKHKTKHCVQEDFFLIGQPAAALLIDTVSPTSDTICFVAGSGYNGIITVEATGGTTPYQNYRWEKQNPATSIWELINQGAALTQLTALAPGDYRIVVYDANNCADTVTHTIIAFVAPSAHFTFDVVCPGQPTTLTADSTLYPFYSWTLTGNTTPVGGSPSLDVVFDETASPTAQLTVTDVNNCQSSSAVVPISLLTSPTVDFTTPATCLNDPSLLTDQSVGGNFTTITWRHWEVDPSIPGPSQSSASGTFSPVITPAGTHVVKLTVTDAQAGKNGLGCMASLTKNIEIAPLPVADFITPPAFNCAFNLMTLTDNSPTSSFIPPITEATWKLNPSGPSTTDLTAPFEVTVSATPGSTVSYDYTIKAATIATPGNSLQCQSLPTTKSITVPSAIAISGQATSVCLDSAVVMWIDSTALPFTLAEVDQIVWNFGGTPVIANPATSFKQVFAAGFNIPGLKNGSVSLTLTNGCTYTDSEIPFTVFQAPTAIISSPSGYCDGVALVFDGSGSVPAGGTIATWQWEVPGHCNSGVTTNPIYNSCGPLSVGSYTLNLTVTDGNGCPGTTTQPLVVNPLPTTDFEYTIVCLGQSTQFTDISTGGNGSDIINHEWTVNGGSPFSTSNIVYVTPLPNAGDNTVKLVVTDNNQCQNEITKTVEVAPLPVADFTGEVNCEHNLLELSDASGVTPPSNYVGGWYTNLANNQSTPGPTASFAVTTGTVDIKYVITAKTAYTTPVNNLQCQSLPVIKSFVVPAPIVVEATATPNCMNLPVTFTIDAASLPFGIGEVTKLIWDLKGDGSQLVSEEPPTDFVYTHTAGYTSSGTYHAKVSLFRQETSGRICQYDDTDIEVAVYDAPVAIIDGEFCADHVLLDGSLSQPFTGSIVSWQWEIRDMADIVIESSPVLTVPDYSVATPLIQGNTYKFTLTVMDGSGLCPGVTTQNITINGLPAVDFVATPSYACGRMTLSATNPVSFQSYEWAFSNGLPATDFGQVVDHDFGGTGNFNATLLITNNNTHCANTITKPVVIEAPVINNITTAPLNPTLPCGETQFTADIAGGYTSINQYTWTFEGVPEIFGAGPPQANHLYALSGSYTVDLTVRSNNMCESAPYSQLIDIHRVPDAVSIDVLDPDPCQYDTVFLVLNAPVNDPEVAYHWDFGAGATPPDYTSFFPHAAPVPANGVVFPFGTSTITLTAYNTAEPVCETEAEVNITVSPAPVAGFDTVGPACMSGPIHFHSTSTVPAPGSIAQYEWTIDPAVPGFNHTGATPDYIFSAGFSTSGNYTVTLLVTTLSGCTDTSTMLLEILPTGQADFNSANVCFGEQMWFANTTPNPALVNQYKWTFPGEGTFMGVTPPPVNFSTPGDKAVTLEIVDNNGCPGFATTKTYRVWIPPTTAFTVTPNDTLCLTDTALFTDVSTPGDSPVINRLWYFGDIPFAGYASTGNTISHHYTAVGTYSPTLITTDQNGCQSQVTQYDFVTVVPQPVVSFHPSSPVACSGTEITFFDDSYVPVMPPLVIPIVARTWKIFEPGNPNPVFTSTDENPSFTFPVTATDLTYTVRLISYSAYSCADSSDQLYTVFAGPDVQFAIQGQCEGLATSFTNLSTPFGNQWLWNFGENGATSTLPAAIHTYSAPGTYNVSLTVTGSNGCANTHDTTIAIFEKAVAFFDFDKVCFGDSTHFNNLSTVAAGSITSFAWNFDDPMSGLNNLSTAENPTHLFSAPGLFDVQLQTTDSHDCLADTIMQVKVYQLPEAQYTLTSVACAKDLVLFDDHSNSADTTLAQWDYNFADGNSVTLEAPGSNGDTTHRYLNQGQFITWMKVTDHHGCTDSTSRAITIKPLPVAGFSSSDTSCINGLVFFTDTSFYNNVSVTERRWIFDITNPQQIQLGLPGSATVNHNYLLAGSYQAQLIVTDQNGCADTTLPQAVEVNPGLDFEVASQGYCFNDSTLFEITTLTPAGNKIESVVWQFDQNQFSNLESPKYKFPEAGPQQVTATVTDTNGCTLTRSHFLTIHPLPVAVAANDLAGCNDSTHFTTTSLPMADSMVSWQWFFGYNNASAIITSPRNPDTAFLYPPHDSLYSASLVVINSNLCSDTAFFDVKRFPCVYAEFDTAQRYCERQSAWFADQSFSGSPSVSIAQWEWTWGDGTDTTYNTPVDTLWHTFTRPGNFEVRLVVSSTVFGELKTDTAYHTAHVNPTPRPDFAQTRFCEKETIQLTAIDTLSTAITQWWIWTPDGGSADTTPVLNHYFADSGYYNIGLRAVSDSGCVADTLKQIFINPLPELYLTLSDSVVCADTAVITLRDTSVNTYQRYEWQPGDGNMVTTGTTDSLVYTYPWNDYTAVLTATSAAGCVNSDTAHLWVRPLPRAVIEPIPDSVGILVNLQDSIFFNGINSYTLNGASIEQYLWTFGDGKEKQGYGNFHPYYDTGHYVVRLYATDQFGCTGTDSTLAYIFPEKVYWLPSAFSPNGDGRNEELRLIGRYFRINEFYMGVFNRYGALIFETTDPDGFWDGSVNGDPAPSAVYIVKISVRGLYGEKAEETYPVMLIR